MKQLLISGLALALLTGGAMAQQAPAPNGAQAAPPPAAAAPGPMGADAGAPPPPPPGGPRGPGPGPKLPPPPPPRGAHFLLTRGDASLDVKCADDEPMKNCADIALQMLDKLQAMPATGAASTPAPVTPKP